MSIWNLLEDARVTVVPLSQPKAGGPPRPLTARVVEAFEPDPAIDEAPPAPAELTALCRAVAGPLGPGLLAVLPQDAAIDRAALTVAGRQLRLGGAPLRDVPYALIELALDDHVDLATLDDLDELRRGLHDTFARAHGHRQRQAAVDQALARLRADVRLTDRDRARLASALEDELRDRYLGHGAIPASLPPWTTFVERLPAWTSGARPMTNTDDPPATATDDPPATAARPPVHWNTRLLDGAAAVGPRPLEVGHRYAIETRLAPAPAPDATATAMLAAGAVTDGTEVRFVIACDQPILGDDGAPPTTRVEDVRRYRRATGDTEPLIVGLRPTQPGPVVLTLTVITDNAIRASTTVMQFAIAPAAAMPPPAAVTSDVAAPIAGLGGPPAQLRLELTSTSELRLATANTIGQPCRLPRAQADLIKIAADGARDLLTLSRGYQADPANPPFGIRDSAGTMAELARIGAAMHDAFFGHPDEVGDPGLQQLARDLAASPLDGGAARLQIGAGFQPFPWAVMYDGAWRTPEATAVDPRNFWGHRFRIDRAIVGHCGAARAPVVHGRPRVQPFVNPHVDDEQAALGVKVVETQRTLFVGLGADDRPAITSDDGFAEFLGPAHAPCDLLYFFCHAHAAHDLTTLLTYTAQPADDQARLVLGQGPGINVDRMRTLRRKPLADAPLVVLNACGSVAGDPAFTSPLLFQFLDRWRAIGVLGTDWEIPTVFADAFARRLVQYFLRDRLPLGEAFARTSDDAFAQGNPFPLIYALYAPPELVCVPAPSPSPPA